MAATTQLALDQQPSVVHVVPLTSTLRGYRSEMTIEPDPDNGIQATSAAQCQHSRGLALGRLANPLGDIAPQARTRIHKILADLLDLQRPAQRKRDEVLCPMPVSVIANGRTRTRRSSTTAMAP